MGVFLDCLHNSTCDLCHQIREYGMHQIKKTAGKVWYGVYAILIQLIIMFYCGWFVFLLLFSIAMSFDTLVVTHEMKSHASHQMYLIFVIFTLFFVARSIILWCSWHRAAYRVLLYTSVFDWVGLGVALYYYLRAVKL